MRLCFIVALVLEVFCGGAQGIWQSKNIFLLGSVEGGFWIQDNETIRNRGTAHASLQLHLNGFYLAGRYGFSPATNFGQMHHGTGWVGYHTPLRFRVSGFLAAGLGHIAAQSFYNRIAFSSTSLVFASGINYRVSAEGRWLVAASGTLRSYSLDYGRGTDSGFIPELLLGVRYRMVAEQEKWLRVDGW